jgi:hypothetical protein
MGHDGFLQRLLRGARQLTRSSESEPKRPTAGWRSPLFWVVAVQGVALIALAVWIFVLSERMAALEMDACLFGGLC